MHIRCPHCHNPIEVVGETSLTEIDCPSCGSSFSLIGDDTTQAHRSKPRRLAHFELVRELGIGKFGSVWMARDTELDRTVAIKIPRKGALDAEESELFLRDARAAAQLKHPHIVGVHEVGREDGTLYIVSDYVEGANLKEWLSGQKLSFRESAELVVKVAEALEHAHQAGVVHRDLKPSNIMVDVDGQPHVIDFGLAKREAGEITMTVEGHILGTPAYMSPEQARGKGHEADARSDVYSLGVILFELLTSELPFRGNQRMLLHQVLKAEPRSPRSLNDRIPRDLETICLKAMAKEPARRYQTAQALSDDLNRYLAVQPILARPVRRLERAWRWCRRKPAVAALSASVVLALMLGMIVSWYFAADATAQRRVAEQKADEALIQKKRADQKAEEAFASAKKEAEAIELVRDAIHQLALMNPNDHNLWYLHTVSHLNANDMEGYHQSAADMLDRFGGCSDPEIKERVLYTCLPGSHDPVMSAKLLTLAETAVPRLRGAALCRAGKYRESLSQFDESAKTRVNKSWDWCFIAMSQHAVGQPQLAKTSLGKAKDWLATHASRVSWYERLESKLLCREVETLLGVSELRGRDKPYFPDGSMP